jgi:hypothetical protein
MSAPLRLQLATAKPSQLPAAESCSSLDSDSHNDAGHVEAWTEQVTNCQTYPLPEPQHQHHLPG